MKLMCSSQCSGLGSSGRYISNVSLDVLPVKGPPLSPSEPVPKLENSWSIKPDQLVLTAPTISKIYFIVGMWFTEMLMAQCVWMQFKSFLLLVVCRQCSWHQARANPEPFEQRAELWTVLARSLPDCHPTTRSHWTPVWDLHKIQWFCCIHYLKWNTEPWDFN